MKYARIAKGAYGFEICQQEPRIGKALSKVLTAPLQLRKNIFMEFKFLVLCFLILPLLISASLHMVVVRRQLLQFAVKPLSKPLFGANKTWRGFLVMPIFTAMAFIATSHLMKFAGSVPDYWPRTANEQGLLGMWLGLAYVLFELPNSYIKRRLGVPAGKKAEKNAWLFTFIDQADSALGCALCYLIFIPASAPYFIPIVIFGPIVHLIGNVTLYRMGLRKEAF